MSDAVIHDTLVLCRLAADFGKCRESFYEVPYFQPRNMHHGQLRYGVKSVWGCRLECQRRSSCDRFVFVHDTQLFGVDVNRVCYLFRSDTTFDRNIKTKTGVSVYLRVRCLSLDVLCSSALPSAIRSHCRLPVKFRDQRWSNFLDPFTDPTHTTTTTTTRMWANAQPDGRPAEHRWRPLFNAAKFS